MPYTLRDKIVYDALCQVAGLNLPNLYLAGGIALQLYVTNANPELPLRPTNDIDFSTVPPLKKSEFNDIYNRLALNGKKGKDREGFFIQIGLENDPFFLHFEKPTNSQWEEIGPYRKRSLANAREMQIGNRIIKVARLEEICAAKDRRINYVSSRYKIVVPSVDDPKKYLDDLETHRRSLSSYFEASIEAGTEQRLLYNLRKDAFDLWLISMLIRMGVDFDQEYLEELKNN
ncbi:MAG: hypothetical protein QXZ43_04270 [Candidatus Aenigmatarchaeota archaeon]